VIALKEYKLTMKQERFINDVISGMSQADAYRNNYSVENMKDETIYVRASELMALSKVKVRYNELLDKHKEKAIFTRDQLLEGLKSAFYMALGIEPTPRAVKSVIDGLTTVEEMELKDADLKAVSGIAEKIAKLEGWTIDRVRHETEDNNFTVVIKKAGD